MGGGWHAGCAQGLAYLHKLSRESVVIKHLQNVGHAANMYEQSGHITGQRAANLLGA